MESTVTAPGPVRKPTRALGGPRRLTMYLANSPCSSAGSARAVQFLFAGALLAAAISNANSGESRPGANSPASQAGQSLRPSRSTENIDTSGRRTSGRICEPSPALQLTPHDQLMSEHRILRLKPPLRLEGRGQNGQKKPNQRDHRTNLADSSLNKAG
jgi:hypothetical protein